jgi:penicillin-binding protein 2
MIGSRRDKAASDVVRVRVLLALMLIAFGVLAVSLYNVQVSSTSTYETALDRQSMRRIRMPGMRGRILDRNGEIFADNRPSYNVAIFLEELRLVDIKVAETLEKLRPVVGYPASTGEKEILDHVHRFKPLPLMAWRDLDEAALARFSEQCSMIPGVDIQVEAVREYPQGSLASHVVGYVSRSNMLHDVRRPFHFYADEMIGLTGIERRFDGVLRGQAGGRLMQVDVEGFRREDIAVELPKPGSDVQLAIDLEIQRAVEEELKDTVGSAVIVDPRNGDILAMASSPSIDPNLMVPFITSQMWNSILQDPNHPLLNRAIQGNYTPGSVIKPIVALAGLENGQLDPEHVVHCPGSFMLGSQKFGCWLTYGHGDMNLAGAIQNSCNVYFFTMGLEMGREYIVHMGHAVGLGRQTEIGIGGEHAGLVPDAAWKRERLGESWWDGDTCNLSIGQGPITVTPLQMALVTAAIANGGTLYRPRLVRGVRAPGGQSFQELPATVKNNLDWSDASLDVVRHAMLNTVMSARGTGRNAAVPGVAIAGKTGPAEFGPKALGKKRGWMIAFAPFDEPRYAVAMVLDHAATGGGADVGPRLRRIFGKLFQVTVSESPPEVGHG